MIMSYLSKLSFFYLVSAYQNLKARLLQIKQYKCLSDMFQISTVFIYFMVFYCYQCKFVLIFMETKTKSSQIVTKSKISLSHWPKQPLQPQQEYKISPTLSKLLKQTNIKLNQIIPISYEQFLSLNDLTKDKLDINLRNSQYYEQYENQIRRRKTQVNILKTIHQKRKTYQNSNKNCTQKNRESVSRLKLIQKVKTQKKSVRISSFRSSSRQQDSNNLHVKKHEYYHTSPNQCKTVKSPTFSHSGHQNKNIQSKLVKSKSQKSCQVVFSFFPKQNQAKNAQIQGKPYIQEYFGQYPRKQKQIIHNYLNSRQKRQEYQYDKSRSISRKTVKNDQKKSRSISRKISCADNKINQYEVHPPGIIKSRKLLNSKNRLKQSKLLQKQKQLCKQLILSVQDYNKVDSRHQQQIKRIRKCDNMSRERLLKIQSIQKNEIRQKIKSLRSRLNSNGDTRMKKQS